MAETKLKRLFGGCFTVDSPDLTKSDLVFVGLPDDSQSSYRRGCRFAPARIRQTYTGECYNSCTEPGVELENSVVDFGDLPSHSTWDETAQSYRECSETLLKQSKIPFFAGGDHAVTVPVVEALSALQQPIHLVQIDAHPDLYPEFDGSKTSHACTAARMLEFEHVHSLTQIGIRTMNKIQSEQVERHPQRLWIYEARNLTGHLPDLTHLPEDALVYLTVDMDAFDPAFAPGVSHAVPGGLTARQVIEFIHNFRGRLVGMDVVEVNPEWDIHDRTAILAAKLLHEAMGVCLKI